MHYRRFGKTNLPLSVFSLGTMRSLENLDTMVAVVKQGLALGINHFETARAYGQSEQLLGQALRQLRPQRSKFYLTTKLLPTGRRDDMSRWIVQSLEHLGVDYIDCLALHGINTEAHLAALTAADGGLAAIAQAQAQGLIRHLGFSTHGSQDVIFKALALGCFEFINLHYYYFFQHHGPIIAQAAALDLGIFIISPTDKGGQLYAPPKALVEQCAPLSPQAFNYRFLLGDRRITTVSVGASHPEHLAVAAALQNDTGPLTPLEQAIDRRLQGQQAIALGSDRCSQCYQCLPCPEAIHIPEILRLRNLAVAHDMTHFGQYRYRMLEQAGHWFPGRRGDRCTDCGDCLPRCPEQLDIPALLRDSHRRLQGPHRRRLWVHEP